MNKQEFESRIGRQVTNEEFEKAERVYMAAVNIDKDTFCEEWERNKLGESEVIADLEQINKNLNDANSWNIRVRNELVAIIANDEVSEGVAKKMADLIGMHDWILAELAAGTELRFEEITYIKNNLK